MLQFPAHWQVGENQAEPIYSGPDGFLRLTAVSSAGPTADVICQTELEANANKDHRFGSKPRLETFQVNGQPACLLLPSADQAESQMGLSLLVVQYPGEMKPPQFLQVWADKEHVREIGQSLVFTPDPEN